MSTPKKPTLGRGLADLLGQAQARPVPVTAGQPVAPADAQRVQVNDGAVDEGAQPGVAQVGAAGSAKRGCRGRASFEELTQAGFHRAAR